MKNILSLLLVFGVLSAKAQVKNPIKWTFEAKKIDAKTYELHMTASLDPRWHIYSLEHKGDIGVATTFAFTKNPLGELKGVVKASQKPVKQKDPSTGEMVAFYEGRVVFTQIIQLKAPVKTSISGSVEFMACDDKMCLPPSEKTFTLALQ